MLKIALLVLIIIGLGVYIYYLVSLKQAPAQPDLVSEEASSSSIQTPQKLLDDPDYREVAEKYHLSEEQLQILSTVNPGDNE